MNTFPGRWNNLYNSLWYKCTWHLKKKNEGKLCGLSIDLKRSLLSILWMILLGASPHMLLKSITGIFKICFKTSGNSLKYFSET